jgi:F-type H+-transporting ATPase subunit delta
MTPNAAARQYASALFDVAARKGIVDRVRQDLTDFAGLMNSHADLARVLVTPTVPIARKRALVDAIAGAAAGMTGEVRRLLDLLADRDRLMLLDDVVAAFAERSMSADRVVTAEVTSAAPLEAESRAALIAALSQAVGRQVTVTERVDPAIIGGVVARVGSLVFDGSVARQLERIREKLVAEA